MVKKRDFELAYLDLFAQVDSLKFQGVRGHGSMCGAMFSITLFVIMAAYLANELLMKDSAFKTHTSTFRSIDYNRQETEV